MRLCPFCVSISDKIVSMLWHLALAAVAGSHHVSLFRGGPGDQDFRYWAVEDTTLSQTRPIDNFGRELTLESGPGKTILIRFADLPRILGRNATVSNAKLTLHRRVGLMPKKVRVSVVRDVWGEGPGRTLLKGITAQSDHVASPNGTNGAANWRFRMGGTDSLAWSVPGASLGTEVNEIKGVTVAENGDALVLSGLDAAVQAMYANPGENFGIAIQTDEEITFASSDSPDLRPSLDLDFENATVAMPDLAITKLVVAGGTAEVTIQNTSDTPSKEAVLQWRISGRRAGSTIVPSLGKGQSKSFQTQADSKSCVSASIVTTGADAWPADNVATHYGGARQVAVDAADAAAMMPVVEFVNSVVFPQSRFSFAMQGSSCRIAVGAEGPKVALGSNLRASVRNVLLALGVPELRAPGASTDMYPGILGYGDTRDDVGVPRFLPLRYEPVRDPLIEEAKLAPTDLLSATEVAILASNPISLEKVVPKVIVTKWMDEANRPLANCDLEIVRQSAKGALEVVATVKTSESGAMRLPEEVRLALAQSPQNAALGARKKDDGNLVLGYIKLWQAADAMSRSRTDLAQITAEMPLASVADVASNLANGRIITDSLNRFPAELKALCDGDRYSQVEFSDNGWVTIDLGRDRVVAEVRLTVMGESIWPSFDINFWGTGQSEAIASRWGGTTLGPWTLENRSEMQLSDGVRVRDMILKGVPTEMRYIKLQFSKAVKPVQISEIRALSLKN